MGSPLGPTLASIFLCHHERNWLRHCPTDFKPIHYHRYVDDTLIIFKEQSHSDIFLHYLNSKHSNILFTLEKEQNGQIHFLDLTLIKNNTGIDIKGYRKPTFSGLGISYLSNSPL